VWIAQTGQTQKDPIECSPPHNSTPSIDSPKVFSPLSDDALIDAYHQAADDHRPARAEGSDNLNKVSAQTLAAEKAMRDRFPDYRTRYKVRYP
jgi:hypothetical protein